MTAVNNSPSNLLSFASYTVAFLYSTTGIGQIVGIPLALILTIKGIVHLILSKIEEKDEQGSLLSRPENYDKAIKSFKNARNFMIGMIPFVGGIIVLYRELHKIDRMSRRIEIISN